MTRDDQPTSSVYDKIGAGYTITRQADPRIERQILDALGEARSVVNVGAGTGAYEPTDREVLAVEPSRVMRAQRPSGAAPCIDASAESLPFPDGAFDAAMAILSLHHWSDWRAGVRELRRVARRRVVILTYDADFGSRFWLRRDYLPELGALDSQRFPSIEDQAAIAGDACVVTGVLIPHDCHDGFEAAYWRRPRAYLDPEVRAGISTFQIPGAETLLGGLDRLAQDLETGRWEQSNRDILDRTELDLGLRLLTAQT